VARPKKEIDWDIVEKHMEAGCSAREIAGALAIEINTFYDRFKEEYGSSFGDYAGEFYKGGDANLKYMQYIKALSGNVNMLMWLGKIRLGQREPLPEIQNKSNITIHVNGQLGSGIKVSSPILSDTADPCTE